jgi:hypothetical protein
MRCPPDNAHHAEKVGHGLSFGAPKLRSEVPLVSVLEEGQRKKA